MTYGFTNNHCLDYHNDNEMHANEMRPAYGARAKPAAATVQYMHTHA